MRGKTFLAFFILLIATSSFSASLFLSPESQTTDQTCMIYIRADGLVNAKGLDLEILWDKDIVECSSVLFAGDALPGFSEFYQRIDNDAGYLEVVLLKQSSGGYTGTADSFLVLTFEPVSGGTTDVYIKRSYQDGDPLLIDVVNTSIPAEVSKATLIVPGQGPQPTATRLYQNYPNPFNPLTTIRFDVPSQSPVWLKIYDAGGRLIRTLLDGTEYGYGNWEIRWDGKDNKDKLVPSGIYFCVLEASGQRSSRKMVILR